MHRRLPSFCCALLLLAPAAVAQEEPPFPIDEEQLRQLQEAAEAEESEERVIPPQEPMSPKEALFLAIELRDVEAAREALESGADTDLNLENPSPLGTAALYNDLRMVVLLLDYGADPGTVQDDPLEEAIRYENLAMVGRLMRAGAPVPAAAAGQQLFRLAQRGETAQELSGILLDHGADPNLCLAAATVESRIDLMEYCLSRGAEVRALPAEVNALAVALASGETGIVDLILEQGPAEAQVAGAFSEAIAAGRMDLVQRAVNAGARPAFEHVETAVESRQPEICLFLLEQSAPDDPSALGGGDVEGLIQRASDLGFDEVAAAIRRQSGISAWKVDPRLPPLAGIVLAAVLGGLALRRVIGGRKRRVSRAAAPMPRAPQPAAPPPAAPEPAPAVRPRPVPAPPAAPDAPQPSAPAAVGFGGPAPAPPPAPAAAAFAVPPPQAPAPAQAAPGAPAAPVALPAVSPAATIPVGSIQMPGPAGEAPAIYPPPAAAPPGDAGAVPAMSDPGAAAAPEQAVAGDGTAWQLVPEPVAEARPAVGPEQVVASAVAAEAAVELRMPEVDLSRDATSVFEAARRASSGETVRPDAPDRRQVVLVTPSRVTMLHSCPPPGSLAGEQLAVAERIAPAAAPRNVAVIAYTELDPMSSEVSSAIPFFQLLGQLGYLGHAVWIFEGHVSAMAAGCTDADVLIVDDGMMPYLPGNWRGVATRAMRGSDIHLFERKTGSLRRLT